MASGSGRYRDDDFDDEPRSRRRDRDDFDDDRDDDPGYAPRRPPAKTGINVVGLIALIMGIVGLPLAAFPCTFFIGLPLAGVGLLLGIIGLFTQRQSTGRGMPIAGTCVSLAGVLIGGGWLIFVVYLKGRGEEKIEAMRVELEKQQQIAQERAKADEEQRKKADKELREGKAIVVTAKDLDKAYSDNVISADKKYKGMLLEVNGTVEKVDRDRFGKPWIQIKTDGDAVMRCEFPKEAQAELGMVQVNKMVTIRGRCKGKTRTREGIEEIILENCILATK